MQNNAILGFTIQGLICNKYNIIPQTEKALNCFNSAYDSKLATKLDEVVKDIFYKLKQKPVECTTFSKKINGHGDVPYNFILSDNSSISIRTNITGKMIAPREVGQAGYEKLNKYFGRIYGKQIIDQTDIKKLFIFHIDEILPIFFNFLFDADYIVWIFNEDNSYKYKIIKGDQDLNIVYLKENFTFTRDFEHWVESTTIKYKGVSIAEVQIHKNRTFKLRFKMTTVLSYLFEKQKTNETLGVTAEKVICDLFNLDYPQNFLNRYSDEMQYQLEDIIRHTFNNLPVPIKYCGNISGPRGGNSKSSVDFILKGDKTLSLKTNIGKMVCPPEVGQPNDKTCYLYFKDFVDGDCIDKAKFKKMVYEHIDELIPIYLHHLFDCDYLLRIYSNTKNDAIKSGYAYGFDIIEKGFGCNFKWRKENFSFTQESISTWNESNTVSYSGISLGEFQVHNNRNCFKFRFNFDNLLKIIIEKNSGCFNTSN